jgi:hypothetical protein
MDADRTGLATWEYKIYELLDDLECCETELNAMGAGPPAAVPGLAGQPRGEGFDLPVTALRPGQVPEATRTAALARRPGRAFVTLQPWD